LESLHLPAKVNIYTSKVYCPTTLNKFERFFLKKKQYLAKTSDVALSHLRIEAHSQQNLQVFGGPRRRSYIEELGK
jgi:hypothetical protein